LSGVVESFLSRPAIICKIIAQSRAVFAIGPIVSRLDAIGIVPNRETRPYETFNPVAPQKAAGCRIDPPVSVPIDAAQKFAATAAADPPELPPATREKSCGFLA
jgi:hypothetical protein